MNLIKSAVGIGLGLSLAFGCASREKQAEAVDAVKPQASTEVVNEDSASKAGRLAADRGDAVVSTIRFNKGSRDLSSGARAELEKAINLAKQSGAIDDVTVAVWSDEEYPAKNEKLPNSQVKLANERGDAIENYLDEKLDVDDVKVHNMAKRPSTFDTFIRRADTKLKQKLESEGLAPTTADEPVFNGRSATALIMVHTKGEKND